MFADIRKKTGILLLTGGLLAFAICLLTAFAMSIRLIILSWGLVWGIIAILLAPIILVVFPWYALIVHHYWYPVAIFYIGSASCLFIAAYGGSLARKK